MFSTKKYTYEELVRLAFIDELTGLFNRRWLSENTELVSKKKYVFFLDINNLKFHNSISHKDGDEYMLKCIQTINLSDDDILIRYGGDEFLLFSNDTIALHDITGFSIGHALLDGAWLHNAMSIANSRMIKNKERYYVSLSIKRIWRE